MTICNTSFFSLSLDVIWSLDIGSEFSALEKVDTNHVTGKTDKLTPIFEPILTQSDPSNKRFCHFDVETIHFTFKVKLVFETEQLALLGKKSL